MKLEQVSLTVRIQAVMRGRIARTILKRLRHRTQIAKEILSTEQVYFDTLKTVIDFYLTPLLEADRKGSSIINKEQIRGI